MNIPKVCNSAEFVNYVKPEVTMIEMEVEGSLLLTTSGGSGSVRFGGNVTGAGGNTLPGATNGGRWSSTPGTTVGNNGIQSVGNGGKHSF